MRNVKLPSGFVKVERTEEEKRRSFAVNDDFVEKIRRRITSDTITGAAKVCKKPIKSR